MEKNKKITNTGTKIRSRRFAGMRNYGFENYDYSEDEKGNRVQTKKATWKSKEEWKKMIIEEFNNYEKMGNYDEIYYVFHDRDIDENGQEKELHVHYVVRYRNPRSLDNIAELFNTELRNINKVVQEAGALRYLSHTTEDSIRERKTRYNVSEITIITNKRLDTTEDSSIYEVPVELTGEDRERYYRVRISSSRAKVKDTAFIKETVDKVCVKIASGDLDLRDVLDELEQCFRDESTADKELALRVWHDNKGRFEEAERLHYEKVQNERKKQGRNLTTIYISGGGGLGKTAIARTLANLYLEEVEKKNPNVVGVSDIHTVSNAGGRKLDFLSGYRQEQATLFDDLSATAFQYQEFLNVFDPKQASLYSSRFNNKAWFSDLAIITRSTNVNDYISTLSAKMTKGQTVTEAINIKWQVARRFSLILDVNLKNDKYTIDLFKFKGNSTNYELDLIDTYKTNYDLTIFDREDVGDIIKKIVAGMYTKFKLEDILINNKKPQEVYNYTDMYVDEYKMFSNQFNKLKKQNILLNIKSERLYEYVRKEKIKKSTTILKVEDVIKLTNLVSKLESRMSAMSFEEIKKELALLEKLIEKYTAKYNKVKLGVGYEDI